MRALSLVLPLLALPAAAQGSLMFCGGSVEALRFEMAAMPGAQGEASFSVQLRNLRNFSQVVRVQPPGMLIGRPPEAITLTPNATMQVRLGVQPNLDGGQRISLEQVREGTRLSCPGG